MATQCFLGIDAGTQGLSVVLTDETLNVLATGDGGYEMVAGLDEGCYEQRPDDWIDALRSAMTDLRNNLPAEHADFTVLCIGVSGQMHGEVLADSDGNSLGPARLWCDSRNESEGDELTRLLGVKMPKRITAARWLWTIRNQADKAAAAKHMTTPAGWISHRLTGDWTLGIGDAAGMFPIDQTTQDYDSAKLAAFDGLAGTAVTALRELLPTVRRAGEDAGALSATGAKLLGLPVGVPVAAAEGDQPASLAGSLIGEAGMVSVSFGTSVCANSVGDRAFEGVSQVVDHFCAPDGKPINMVFLRNGTTFMNSVVGMFGGVTNDETGGFATVMPAVLKAAPDCGGVLALPFMDDEPGLGISRGGTATLVGLNSENANAGNTVKAALLATIFNLRIGSEVLDNQGYPRNEIILTGGLTKTPELAQILADVFHTPVVLLESAEEGCAWGAAVMAKFRQAHILGATPDWADFLAEHAGEGRIRYEPNSDAATAYRAVFERYRKLMNSHGTLADALA